MYFADQNIIEKGDTEKLNFEGLEMQKLNIPTDKTQRADEKMGLFVWISRFLPELWSLKRPKWLIICMLC